MRTLTEIRSLLLATLVITACAREQSPAPAAGSAPPAAVTTSSGVVSPTQKVVASGSGDLMDKYDRARALLDSYEGRPEPLEQAKALALEMLELDRNFAPAYVILARKEMTAAFIRGEEYDPEGLKRARKFVDHALKLDPNSHDAHLASAAVWIDEGQLDLAGQELDRAEAIDPGNIRDKTHRLRIARREARRVSQLSEPERLAKEIIAETTDPSALFQAWQALAWIYSSRNEMGLVAESYQQQIKLRPQSAWVHGNYAQVLLRHGRTDEAIKEAEIAVNLMPYGAGLQTLYQAYVTKARELTATGRPDQADVYTRKAEALRGR